MSPQGNVSNTMASCCTRRWWTTARSCHTGDPAKGPLIALLEAEVDHHIGLTTAVELRSSDYNMLTVFKAVQPKLALNIVASIRMTGLHPAGILDTLLHPIKCCAQKWAPLLSQLHVVHYQMFASLHSGLSVALPSMALYFPVATTMLDAKTLPKA